MEENTLWPRDIIYSSSALQRVNKPKLDYEKLISLMDFENVTFEDLKDVVNKYTK